MGIYKSWGEFARNRIAANYSIQQFAGVNKVYSARTDYHLVKLGKVTVGTTGGGPSAR